MLFTISLGISLPTNGQMRPLFYDLSDDNNSVVKTSFYSASEGYVAFSKWIGYTTDTGRSFIRRYINFNNVDYNFLYPVNTLFGFEIRALKAFDKNNIIVAGSYGWVPAILRSTDGGISFKLVLHSRYDIMTLKTGITDMVFPENNNVGYAVDSDRILRTTNGGQSWSILSTIPDAYFTKIAAVDNSNIFIISDNDNKNTLFRLSATGLQQLTKPAGFLNAASFITPSKGWLAVGNSTESVIYYTSNAGVSWKPQTISGLTGFSTANMKFINDSTGYALSNSYVYKTTDSGKIWEAFSREAMPYPAEQYLDLQIWSPTHFWAGGNHGALDITTNGGGNTMPRAFFRIDTTGLSVTKVVKLINFSKSNYQFSWYKNDTLITNGYHASYIHDVNQARDSIRLVVTNGGFSSDRYEVQYFNLPPPPAIPEITSFSPVIAGQSKMITIIGKNFSGTTVVSLGGTVCATFSIVSNTRIDAIVENGSSGIVSVTNSFGTATLAGFTFVPKPVINSFTPQNGPKGTVITILGTRFTGATAVSIGTVAVASYTVVDDNTITAVLANGASGKVSVTTIGGKDEKDGFVFNYPSSVGFVSPSSGGVGDTVFLKGSWFTGTVSVTIGGINAASFRVISDTLMEVIIGVGNNGPIAVTNAYGAGEVGYFSLIGPPVFNSFGPMEAGEDIEVEIVGAGLSRVTRVTFGGVPAKSFGYSVYWGKWLAVVGAGATGDVTIESKYGSVTRPGFKWFPKFMISSMTPASGVAGTIVTVKGKNLSNVREVFIGGQSPSSFNIISDSVLNIVVGLGATGNITVKGPPGVDTAGFFTFISSAVPAITSINPVTGGIGSSATISGNNFNPVANLNTVYFGGVRATVTSASATSLSVTVPPGADYEPVSVTANYLTAYSREKFSVLSPAKSGFDSSSFPFKIDSMQLGSNAARNMFTVDVDLDGKQDFIATSSVATYIFRNISSNGRVMFDSPKIYSNKPASPTWEAAIADLDGDGKLDIATIVLGANRIILYKNNSTPGNIDFSDSVHIVRQDPWQLAIGDLDSDGKPDLIVGNNGRELSILRNLTQGGSFSFATRKLLRLPQGRTCREITVSDINNDNKPDLILGLVNGPTPPPRAVSILTNTTIGNVITFATEINLPLQSLSDLVMVADIDGDSKPDIIAAQELGTVIFRNTSTNATPTFQQTVQFPNVNSLAMSALVNDLDGDGKPDIVISDERSDSITFYRNISQPNNILFSPGYTYKIAEGPGVLKASDFDGDGLPEVCVGLTSAPKGAVRVMMNALKGITIKMCSGSDTSLKSDISGSIYQWEVDRGSGFEALSDNVNYSGTNSGMLKLISVPSTWNNYQYRCKVDGKSSSTIKLQVNSILLPTITIRTDTTTICEGTNTTFTNTTTNADPGYSIQWKLNNTDVSNSITGFTTSLLKNGDEIIAVLKANNACVIAPVQSNTIKMTVNPAVIAEAKITASITEICTGETIRFKAEIKNGGSNPVYTWKVNGIAIVNNTDSLIINTLKNQDQVQLLLTGNAACASPVTSNTVTVKVNNAVKPSAIISGTTDLKPGESSTIIMMITNAGNAPVYQWQDSTTAHTWRVITNASSPSISYKPLSNGEKLRAKVFRTGSCADSVFSNILVFKIQEPDPAPNNVTSYPNPVQNTLIIDSLSSIDEWTSLEITDLNGNQKLVIKNIANQVRVRVEVGHLPKGIYFMIIRRNFGAPAYRKFIKM